MARRISRRQYLASSALAATTLGYSTASPAASRPADRRDRLPVVGITTVYRRDAHADVIFSKILEGYDQQGGQGPALELVGLYVEQRDEGDLSRDLAAKHKVPLFKTIQQAVTIDRPLRGVISVAEHGKYPLTKRTRQRMYPRRRFFDEIAAGLKKRGEVVPVFNDKHLSYKWDDAEHMYKIAKDRNIPFMAGSSIPVAWRVPHLEMKHGCRIEEAVGIGYGGAESYGFHALEGLQCMLERRHGGESGVRSIQAITGEAIWKAEKEGRWSRDLLDAAVACQPSARPGRLEEKLNKNSPFYLIEYRDGLRATLAMMNGVCREFGFAARVKDRDEPLSCRFVLQEPRPYGHFSWLLQGIEEMVHTRQAAYPVERTLLTTGMLDRAMHSLVDGEKKYDTPELNIAYQATRWSFAKTKPFAPPA